MTPCTRLPIVGPSQHTVEATTMGTSTQRSEQPIITLRGTARARAGRAAVYDILSDLATHRVWGGERTGDRLFRLLTLEAPAEHAATGTRFSSTGAAMMGTFHDESVVVDASPAAAFSFHTESTLERKHGETWHATFVHRYLLESRDGGTIISYTCAVHPGNYIPYWLTPVMRPLTRFNVQRVIRRCLRNLAAMAEARAVDVPVSAGAVVPAAR